MSFMATCFVSIRMRARAGDGPRTESSACQAPDKCELPLLGARKPRLAWSGWVGPLEKRAVRSLTQELSAPPAHGAGDGGLVYASCWLQRDGAARAGHEEETDPPPQRSSPAEGPWPRLRVHEKGEKVTRLPQAALALWGQSQDGGGLNEIMNPKLLNRMPGTQDVLDKCPQTHTISQHS